MNEVIDWFANYDIGKIVRPEDPYYKFEDIRAPLETLKRTATDMVFSPELWAELPTSYKNTAIQELETMQRLLTQIEQNRSNAEWLGGNERGHTNSILNVYSTLYDKFVSPVRAYKSTSDAVRMETAEALTRLQEAISEAEESSKQAKFSAKAAGEAATNTAANSLAKHFEHSVIGYPSTNARLKNQYKRTWWFRYQYRRSMSNQRGYSAAARVWFVMVVISIGVTIWVSTWAFHGIDFATVTLQTVLAKALILAAPAYAIRFSVRNYNANKHLSTANRHRSVIMQTLLALLARDEISEAAKEKIITEAAARVFDPGESGYLTSKDSLSGGDNSIQMPSIKY